MPKFLETVPRSRPGRLDINVPKIDGLETVSPPESPWAGHKVWSLTRIRRGFAPPLLQANAIVSKGKTSRLLLAADRAVAASLPPPVAI